MSAVSAIWNSEKGLFGLALIIGCTVLTAIGKVPPDTWISYTQWIFGIYVGGKTIQGAASALAARPAAASATNTSGPAVAVVNNPPA